MADQGGGILPLEEMRNVSLFAFPFFFFFNAVKSFSKPPAQSG